MIQFWKMTGAGNDFVAVDNRRKIITNASAFAVSVCDRRYGVGADGILLIEESDDADFLMKYYNPDGSDGGMCGNGGRCIAMFAKQIGVIMSDNFTFRALDYIYSGSLNGNIVSLRMKNPESIILNREVRCDGHTVMIHSINTGAPHAVVFAEDNRGILMPSFDEALIEKIGKELRWNLIEFPNGTNVNFIEMLDANYIKIRTYERGVEAETLACGTGSIAASIASSLIKGFSSPVLIQTRSKENLTIAFDAKGNQFSNVTLTGPALCVFAGKIAERTIR